MRRLQNQMLRIIQKFGLHLCRTSPQHKHNGTILPVHCADRGIGKFLPSDIPVGISLMRTHGKNCVQQQYTLLRLFYQITVVRNIAAEIILKLLINIHKRRRNIILRLY